MALLATDPASRLLGLIAKAEPRLRQALLSSVTAAQGSPALKTLAALIEAGRFEEAVTVAARAGVIRLADETTAVFTQAGAAGATFLSDVLEVTVGFDQVNLRAVNAMQGSRLRLIREFTAEQRGATRSAMVDGIRRGLNPIDQARNFRQSIGLTTRQQAAVENYRKLLSEGSSEALNRQLRDRRFDSTVRRAARSGKPLTRAQVDRMVRRYSERSVAFRAKVVGRTEALRSVHEGTEEMYRQAIDEGHLASDQLTKTWVTAGDERVRGSHASMNGQTRGMDEGPFVSGKGNRLNHPGDIGAPGSETVQCRCVLTTRIDASSEVTEAARLTEAAGVSPPPLPPPRAPRSRPRADRTRPLDVGLPQVGQRAETLLSRGLSNREVAEIIRREFRGASTTPKSVASVRARLKREGVVFPKQRVSERPSGGSAEAVRDLEAGLPDGIKAPSDWVVSGEQAVPNVYGTFVPGRGVVFNDKVLGTITAQQARQVAAHELGHYMNKMNNVSLSTNELSSMRKVAKGMTQADRRRYAYYLVDENELVAEIFSQALSPSPVTSQGLNAARFNKLFSREIRAARARLVGRGVPLTPKPRLTGVAQTDIPRVKPARVNTSDKRLEQLRGFMRNTNIDEQKILKTFNETQVKAGRVPLNKDEFVAMRSYLDSGYGPVNRVLRGDLTFRRGGAGKIVRDPSFKGIEKIGSKRHGSFSASVSALDDALNKLPVFRGEVRRVMGVPNAEDLAKLLERYKRGSTITELGYVSTTRGPLERLAPSVGGGTKNVKMTITSKTGRVISNNLEVMRSEREVIFPRGTRFRVVSIKKTTRLLGDSKINGLEIGLQEL